MFRRTLDGLTATQVGSAVIADRAAHSIATRVVAAVTAVAHVSIITLSLLPTYANAQPVVPAVVPPPPPSILPTWTNGTTGQPLLCSGQGCADKFRDGQSIGYDVLQWGVANQKDDKTQRINTGVSQGTDASRSSPTGGTTYTRDFIPGAPGMNDLEAWKSLSKQPPGTLMNLSLAARRKANEVGCRTTYFGLQPGDAAYGFLQIGAYVSNRVVDVPATATKPATYKLVYGAQVAHAGPVEINHTAFGGKKDTWRVIRAATNDGTVATQGISLRVYHSGYQAASDSTLIALNVRNLLTTGPAFTPSTVGSPKDSFKIKGVVATVPATGVLIGADMYRVSQDFKPTQFYPGNVCPPDPATQVVTTSSGVVIDMRPGQPYAGIAQIYEYASANPNRAPTTTLAHKTLSDSASADRTGLLKGVSPDDLASTMIGGSQNTIAGNPPVVPRGDNKYDPFKFSVSELFNGCTEVASTTLPGTGTPTKHVVDVQSCTAQIDPNVVRSCTGSRALGFTPFGNYTVATLTSVRSTKSKCASGGTVSEDVPPLPSVIDPTPQQLGGRNWDCPAAAPIYISTSQQPVTMLRRVPDATGNAWTAWQAVDNTSTVCAVTGTAQSRPLNDSPWTITGSRSLQLCMPERVSPNFTTTNTARPFSGTLPFSIRVIGSSEFVNQAPVDPNPGTLGAFDTWQQQYNRLNLPAKDYFPHNLTANPLGGGSVSDVVVTSYGEISNNWTITGSVTANNVTAVQFSADVKYIAINAIVGCEDYMKLLADKVCRIPSGAMTCTDPRTPTATVSGVTFGVTGPLSGVAALLVPWGAKVTAQLASNGEPTETAGGPPETYIAEPPMCFAGTGPNLSCAIPGESATGWANHFPSERALAGYVDNCALRPRNSPPPVTTTPLLSDSTCKYLGPGNCVSGTVGAISGTCYQREVLFDCGPTTPGTPDNDGSVSLSQQCSGALRCMGTECHRPTSEVSQDFAAAASASEIINAIRRHTVCSETGKEPTSATQSCSPILFGGKENICLTPLTSNVGVGNNCCQMADKQAAGMGVGSYVTALTLAWRLKDTQLAQSALGQLGNTTGITAAYNNAANAVSATLQPITNAFGNLMTNLGFNPTTTPAVGSPAAAEGFTSFLEPLKTKIYDMLANAISPLFLEAVGTVSTNIAVQKAAEEAAKKAAEEAAKKLLENINTVLFWYGVAQLVGQLIYSCKESQLTPGLGMARKGGACHFIGQRTSGAISIDRHSVYCCFSSPLARIMQENFRNGAQGVGTGSSVVGWARAQFYGQNLFGGWGTAREPRCTGITPENLLLVDWEKVDLSEWINTLKDNGLLPKLEPEITKRYALDANMTNTIFPSLGGTTPQGAATSDTPQPGPDAPWDRAKSAQAFVGKYGDTMDRVRKTLEPQKTCYDDPQYAAWYGKPSPSSVADIIEDAGGTGTYTPCGVGCVDVTLGTNQNNTFNDSCTQAYPQQQGFKINRPDYILSARIIEANWDDHLQITMNGTPVYTSPQWSSTPLFGGQVCDLGKSWRLNGATPCSAGSGSSCAIVSPSYSSIDVTSYFTSTPPGGTVATNTRVIVGGGGEGYAKMRVTYTPPGAAVNPNLLDPTDPNFRACFSPTGK